MALGGIGGGRSAKARNNNGIQAIHAYVCVNLDCSQSNIKIVEKCATHAHMENGICYCDEGYLGDGETCTESLCSPGQKPDKNNEKCLNCEADEPCATCKSPFAPNGDGEGNCVCSDTSCGTGHYCEEGVCQICSLSIENCQITENVIDPNTKCITEVPKICDTNTYCNDSGSCKECPAPTTSCMIGMDELDENNCIIKKKITCKDDSYCDADGICQCWGRWSKDSSGICTIAPTDCPEGTTKTEDGKCKFCALNCKTSPCTQGDCIECLPSEEYVWDYSGRATCYNPQTHNGDNDIDGGKSIVCENNKGIASCLYSSSGCVCAQSPNQCSSEICCQQFSNTFFEDSKCVTQAAECKSENCCTTLGGVYENGGCITSANNCVTNYCCTELGGKSFSTISYFGQEYTQCCVSGYPTFDVWIYAGIYRGYCAQNASECGTNDASCCEYFNTSLDQICGCSAITNHAYWNGTSCVVYSKDCSEADCCSALGLGWDGEQCFEP